MLAVLANNSGFSLEFAGKKQCLLFAVNNRSAASLLPIIVEQIAPGSLLILDQWSSYNSIRNTNQNYNHQTVNHSRHFIDPGSSQVEFQGSQSFQDAGQLSK